MIKELKAGCAAAALLSVLSAPGQAQEIDPEAPLYLDANTVVRDDDTGVVTASGDVRVQAGERLLLADEVVYDTVTGRVVARGDVRIFDGDEPAQLADEIELTDSLGEGVALGFTATLENQGRTGAAFALRRADGRLELSRAFYTACELCPDGERAPTWRLRASEVIRDPSEQRIYYRDARLEVLGVPVAYSPAFAHADPDAERASGFMMPRVDLSNRTGFNYTQPYYWAISPYQDLTIAPRLMTEVNPMVELDYRRRFYSGSLRATGSMTYERDFDRDGLFGDNEFRGHIFAEGNFRIAQGWDWGFTAQRVTETLYLRKYGFADRPDLDYALYEGDRDLISQVYARGRSSWYYTDMALIDFQSARPGRLDSRLPRIAPIVRSTFALPLPDWAGSATANVSGTAITREQGTDYARASADASWARPFTIPGGVRVTPYAFGRVDAYDITVATNQGQVTDRIDATRVLGSTGVDAAYPFVRPAEWGNLYIEPRVRAAASTGLDPDEIVPNEDSVGFELSRTNLFARNRSNGFDLWEEGVRVDTGVTTALRGTQEWWIPDVELFNGLSYRLDGDPSFGAGSGLDRDQSDLISELDVDFGFLSTGIATRYDTDTGELKRFDLLAGFDIWRVSGAMDYSRLDTRPAGNRVREEIDLRLSFDVTSRWSATFRTRHDFEQGATRFTQAGLIYRDECTDLRILYRRDNLELGNLGVSESIRVQFTLFTLGSISE